LVFALTAGGVLAATAAHADSYELVIGDDYPPFVDTNLPNYGLATDIVQTTFRHMGHQTKLVFRPWQRGFEDSADEKFLGTFPYSKNAEREAEFHYSVPLYTFRQFFFTSSEGSFAPTTYDDLKGHSVCVPVGYSLTGLKDMVDREEIDLVRPRDIEFCFEMLAKQRVDVIRVIDLIGWAMIDKLFDDRDGFRMSEVPVRQSVEHLLLSRAHPDGEVLVKQFDTAFGELQKQGRIHKLIERHLY
jgi:polar amino acid transport system substrate-binding protein